MTPEKTVQNQIIAYFKKLANEGKKVYVERRQAGGFAYKMGQPDLYVVYNGIHIEIELKAPGGHLKTMQEKWRDKCKSLNILWMCASNIDEVKDFLQEHFGEEQ